MFWPSRHCRGRGCWRADQLSSIRRGAGAWPAGAKYFRSCRLGRILGDEDYTRAGGGVTELLIALPMDPCDYRGLMETRHLERDDFVLFGSSPEV
jgi:hypothetical protein